MSSLLDPASQIIPQSCFVSDLRRETRPSLSAPPPVFPDHDPQRPESSNTAPRRVVTGKLQEHMGLVLRAMDHILAVEDRVAPICSGAFGEFLTVSVPQVIQGGIDGDTGSGDTDMGRV